MSTSHYKSSAWILRTFLLALSSVFAALAMLWIARPLQSTVFPDARAGDFPGFTADQTSVPSRGLVVTSLRSGSHAQADGIDVGDEIVAIDQYPVQSLADAAYVLRRSSRLSVTLRLLHDGAIRNVVLPRA